MDQRLDYSKSGRTLVAETYAQCIDRTARALEGAGIENPRREARLLVALAAEIETAELIARERDTIEDAGVLARIEAFSARRFVHEPFAHIARRRAFYGLDFISDARALVPRPDSEILVETALQLLPRGRDVVFADLGTGSACLLAAILHTRGGTTGVGVERDPAAASQARENIKQLGLEDRASIYVGDWADWCGWADMDLIISNPPYIARSDIAGLDPVVRLYDPLQALDGGPDGLAAYRTLVQLAAIHMSPGAWLVLEIGFDQDRAVRTLLRQHNFCEIDGARDLGGNDRVLFAQKSI